MIKLEHTHIITTDNRSNRKFKSMKNLSMKKIYSIENDKYEISDYMYV